MSYETTREVVKDLLNSEYPFEQIVLFNGNDELQETFHIDNGYPGSVLSIHVYPGGPVYSLTWSARHFRL